MVCLSLLYTPYSLLLLFFQAALVAHACMRAVLPVASVVVALLNALFNCFTALSAQAQLNALLPVALVADLSAQARLNALLPLPFAVAFSAHARLKVFFSIAFVASLALFSCLKALLPIALVAVLSANTLLNVLLQLLFALAPSFLPKPVVVALFFSRYDWFIASNSVVAIGGHSVNVLSKSFRHTSTRFKVSTTSSF
jgi:hypothetical protein